MSEPSQFVRVKRSARFTLKENYTVRKPSKLVDKAYAKQYPSQVKKKTVYKAKKTTRSYKKGQTVPESYAKRFRRLVTKATIYRTIATVKTYKQGLRVSEKFALKHPEKVKSMEYMEIEERQVQYDPVTRRQTYGKWRVTSRQKMNFYEQILPVKDLSNRHIRTVFAQNRIFSNIWANHKGMIRISVNGHVDGRRVKNVAHIGYLKSVWETKHNGYEQFKDYVVNKVLQSLRRANLRLSNPKESQARLVDLFKKRKDALYRLESAPSWKHEDITKELKEIQKLIKLQKQSRQIKGGMIRIEKLVS